MSVRICPRCSTLIESASAIFCYSCGQELDRPGFSENSGKVSASSSAQPVRMTAKKSSGFYFFLAFVPALVSILFFSVYYLTILKNEPPKVLLKPSSNEFVSTVSALPISPFKFGDYNFASLTPAAADIYLEGSNVKLFLEKFLSPSDNNTLESKVGLNLDELSSFFEPGFALVEASSSAALIGLGKDMDFLKERSGKLSGEKLKSQVLDQYFVVSDSEALLKDITNAYKKIALPLSMTARYQETVRHLPVTGQLFIYSESLDFAISAFKIYFGEKLRLPVSSLSGTSFVVTAINGSTVIKGQNGN